MSQGGGTGSRVSGRCPSIAAVSSWLKSGGVQLPGVFCSSLASNIIGRTRYKCTTRLTDPFFNCILVGYFMVTTSQGPTGIQLPGRNIVQKNLLSHMYIGTKAPRVELFCLSVDSTRLASTISLNSTSFFCRSAKYCDGSGKTLPDGGGTNSDGGLLPNRIS